MVSFQGELHTSLVCRLCFLLPFFHLSSSPASHVADQMFMGHWSTWHRIFILPGTNQE